MHLRIAGVELCRLRRGVDDFHRAERRVAVGPLDSAGGRLEPVLKDAVGGAIGLDAVGSETGVSRENGANRGEIA